MGEWKRVKLGEICSLITKGATPRGEYQVANSKEAVAFIRAENVNGVTICRSELKCIESSVHQRELKRSQLREGDILITIAGAIGRTAIVDGSLLPANINQAVAIIRLDTADFDRRFVLDYLRLPALREELTAISSGQSVQANLNLHQVGEIEIPCPDLPTQRRIASVLGALDDKIEVNRKICENLEAQAQALFKAWFVDFEPFGGKRPEGWKMGKLGEVVEFKNGFAFKSSEFKERARYKVMTIKAVQNGKLVTEGADCIDDIPTKMPSWCVLRDADVLMSLTGNVARCCLVCEDDLLLNQRVAKLVPRLSGDVAFVYALFRSDEMRKRLETIAKGTAQANLSPIESAELLQLIGSSCMTVGVRSLHNLI